LRFSQEHIVLGIAAALFVVFAFMLPGFIGVDNLLPRLRNVSVLGILGIAMAIVVIGRGIDLSLVAHRSSTARAFEPFATTCLPRAIINKQAGLFQAASAKKSFTDFR